MKGTGQSIWRACKRPGERSTRRGNRVMLVCSDLSQLLQSVAASTLLLGSLSKPFWAPLLSSFSLLACSLCTRSRVIRTFLMSSRPHRHPQCLHGCFCQIKRTSHDSQEDEYKEFHNLGDFSAEYLSFFSPTSSFILLNNGKTMQRTVVSLRLNQ